MDVSSCFFRWAVLALLMACQQGCFQPTAPLASGMVMAGGRVTVGGETMDVGQIRLVPAEESQQVGSSMGFLAAVSEGEFLMEVPPGTYRVEIRQYGEPDENGDGPQLISEEFNTQSSITVEIPAGGQSDLLFEVATSP